jgi:hypothetical protein
MQTYQGYIEDGRIVPIDMPCTLNGRQVVISVLESAPEKESVYVQPDPKRGTLEYLFRDYDGTSFQTELVDLGAPIGNEKW